MGRRMRGGGRENREEEDDEREKGGRRGQTDIVEITGMHFHAWLCFIGWVERIVRTIKCNTEGTSSTTRWPLAKFSVAIWRGHGRTLTVGEKEEEKERERAAIGTFPCASARSYPRAILRHPPPAFWDFPPLFPSTLNNLHDRHGLSGGACSVIRCGSCAE